MKIRLSYKKEGTYKYRLLFTPKKTSTDYVVGAERRFAVTVDFPAPKKQATGGSMAVAVAASPTGPALTVSLPDKRHDIPCQALLCKK